MKTFSRSVAVTLNRFVRINIARSKKVKLRFFAMNRSLGGNQKVRNAITEVSNLQRCNKWKLKQNSMPYITAKHIKLRQSAFSTVYISCFKMTQYIHHNKKYNNCQLPVATLAVVLESNTTTTNNNNKIKLKTS